MITGKMPILLAISTLTASLSFATSTDLPFFKSKKCKSDERHITILGTNDIHGALDEHTNADGSKQGGMSILAGMFQNIRKGIEKEHGNCGGTITLDAGDQFQGTLLSNYTEGLLMFKIMNEAGYDAVVPGNHDYDFGPKGWLVDKVIPLHPDQNPRSVIEGLARKANFPLLSANTYFKSSITDSTGRKIEVDGVGCTPKDKNDKAEFLFAKRPDFLKPYIIKEVAGVRVAIIGLDNLITPTVTMIENISDLCYRSPLDEYKALRSALSDKADLFVITIHDGDTNKEFNLTKLIENLTDKNDPTKNLVDVVIAGHTHFVNNVHVNGVYGLQSGASAKMFGRADLVFNIAKKRVDSTKTQALAGMKLFHEKCDDRSWFCTKKDKTLIHQIPLEKHRRISKYLEKGHDKIASIADRKLGIALETTVKHRTDENALSNQLCDALRKVTATDVAFLNGGGIREDIQKGDLTYEILYRALPFSNHAIVSKPVKFEIIKRLLERSVKSCGSYGSLMPSGLKIQFVRNCDRAVNGVDEKAELMHVETVAGEILFDRDTNVTAPVGKTLTVATLDYLMSGGSGFDAFKEIEMDKDIGIMREILVDEFLKNPIILKNTIDDRMSNIRR